MACKTPSVSAAECSETADDAVKEAAAPSAIASAALSVECANDAGTDALAGVIARCAPMAAEVTVTPRRDSRPRKSSRARERRPLTVPTGQPNLAAA